MKVQVPKHSGAGKCTRTACRRNVLQVLSIYMVLHCSLWLRNKSAFSLDNAPIVVPKVDLRNVWSPKTSTVVRARLPLITIKVRNATYWHMGYKYMNCTLKGDNKLCVLIGEDLLTRNTQKGLQILSLWRKVHPNGLFWLQVLTLSFSCSCSCSLFRVYRSLSIDK